MPRSRLHYALLLSILSLAGLLSIAVGTMHGAASIAAGDCLRVLGSLIGLADASGVHEIDYRIVADLRLPRVLTAFFIGSSLALAGACLQAMFRNPMADPGIIGVGAGGALGAVLVIYSGWGVASLWAIPAGAFVGAAGCTLLVYTLSTRSGRTRVALLLLVGMALNFLIASITAVVLHTAFRTKGYEIGRQILVWTMGGLGDRTWEQLGVLLPLCIAGMIGLAVNARPLNLLLLGEEQAASLGVGVQGLKLQLVVISAVLTAAAVAFAGVIAFVGLVVPHMVRIWSGPNHTRLLPACALGGGVFLCVADLLARTVVRPEALPLGVVAGLVGGPFFLLMLVRAAGRESWL